MDIERYHREVVEYGRNDFSYSVRKIHLDRSLKACNSRCVAGTDGAHERDNGSICRCEHHKNELRDYSKSNGGVIDRRRQDSDIPLRSISPFNSDPAASANANGAVATVDATHNAESAISDPSSSTGPGAISTATSSDNSDDENAAESIAAIASVGITQKGGLSTGSKAGLGIGVGLGTVLLLLAVAFFCLTRRRKRKAARMGAKYMPHAQADMSMIEQYQLMPKETELAHKPGLIESQPLHGAYHEQFDSRHSQVYYEPLPPPPPPVNVFQTPATRSSADADSLDRNYSGAPSVISIPGGEVRPGISREQSLARSPSPASPVSPVSAVPPVKSRAPSPKVGTK